jgi:ADP-ribosylglycohydrolase
MCNVSIVHGGDNDSTATIAGAWYGAYYGMREAPGNHYEYMEGL